MSYKTALSAVGALLSRVYKGYHSLKELEDNAFVEGLKSVEAASAFAVFLIT